MLSHVVQETWRVGFDTFTLSGFRCAIPAPQRRLDVLIAISQSEELGGGVRGGVTEKGGKKVEVPDARCP